MTPLEPAISVEIKRLALAEGFDLAGIAGVAASAELATFPAWIAAERHGEMGYLAARNEAGELKRAALQNAAPWARSVVVCAVNYNSAAPYSTHAGSSREGWIARYAWSETDYHEVLQPKLRKLEAGIAELVKGRQGEPLRSWCYVDTGPVVERVAAKYAGIGWIGKNTCLINQKLGSWLFLGVILTNLELTLDNPADDRCGSCTRCLDACPTHAFTGPHQLDATRCIAYLTIEKSGEIPEEFRADMGRHVFGCDICQDVCPWNRRAPVGTIAELAARGERVNPALDWLAALDGESFNEAFRRSPLKRGKLGKLKRNVAVAIGNSGDPELLGSAERLASDEDEVVAEHGGWAAARLRALHSKKE